MKVVKELSEVVAASTIHPRRRMVIVQREDGSFTFVEQYHYKSEYEGEVIAEGWASLSPEGVYGALDEAEREANAALLSRYR